MASDQEPRIPPIPPTEWSRAMKAATGPLTPPLPRPPGLPRGLNILGTFAHHPDLARAFLVFNGYILYDSRLSDRQRELVILRVAARRKSTYEWEQHTRAASACGITDGEIEAIAAGDTVASWTDVDAALLRAVDELMTSAGLTDETWEAVDALLGRDQVLDLIFTIGTYDVLAMMLGTARTPLDADLRD